MLIHQSLATQADILGFAPEKAYAANIRLQCLLRSVCVVARFSVFLKQGLGDDVDLLVRALR